MKIVLFIIHALIDVTYHHNILVATLNKGHSTVAMSTSLHQRGEGRRKECRKCIIGVGSVKGKIGSVSDVYLRYN